MFQNFPQFIVIHTVKGFGIVNKAEIVLQPGVKPVLLALRARTVSLEESYFTILDIFVVAMEGERG